MPTPAVPQPTSVARLALPAVSVSSLLDALAAHFDGPETAISIFKTPDRGWQLELYFCSAPDEVALRTLLARLLGAHVARGLRIAALAGKDWIATSLASFTPVSAGRFTIHGNHDRGRTPINRISIEIAAAAAFGTGHHGSTRGCLLALDHLLKPQRVHRVLDIGTGSGILAIAAAKALRRPVSAGDIDPRAVAIARANATLNGVGSLVKVSHAADLKSGRLRQQTPFDLVVANILLEPLARLARPIAGVLGRSGRTILSGLLPSQVNAALAAYRRCGFMLERRLMLEGWATIIVGRRQRPKRMRAARERRGRPARRQP
jgi:ribosomal protein L11 methyltransferase